MRAVPRTRDVCAPSYGPLLAGAGEALREWARRGEVVVLAPTRAAADEFVREQAGSGLLGVHRFTPAQFAATLAAPLAAARRLAPISRLSSEALVARVVHQLKEQHQLSYFHPVANTPGFARVLASTIQEIRYESVTAEALRQAGLPCEDLARLSAAYSRELAERKLADLPLLFELATETVDSGKHRLLGLPVICLDAGPEHRRQDRLLAAVAERAPEFVHFRLGGAPSIPATTALEQARAWLFSLERPPERAPDDSVTFFSAAGEGVECVEIARRVVALAEQGTPFDHVAILLRDPDKYQILLEEALRRSAIPAYFSRGTSRPDTAGRAFLALLLCAAEGCSASRFAEYLSLDQVPEMAQVASPEWEPSADEVLRTDEPAPPRDDDEFTVLNVPAGWEKLLVDAAVIGGVDRWRRRLRGLEQEFRMKLAAAVLEDEAEQRRLERRLEQLHRLEQFALPLIEQLSDWPKQAVWGEWLDRLTDVASVALRWSASVLSVVTELEPMAEVGPVGLEEVYGVLEERLRFFRREPEGRRYGAVLVCSIEEARGRHFPVAFLPGLAEGMFPRRTLENPLLLDHYRQRLGCGLMQQDDRAAEERLLLTNALAVADRHLIVSYPSMDSALSRPRVPSFYALEILRAVEGKLPDLATFQKRSAAAAQTRLSWPAPPDPQAALDDAEYDLAALKLMLEGPAHQKGAARYLLEANGNLKRSLQTRGRRWRSPWFEADGLVELDLKARAALGRHRLTQRSYSPSALQNFAQCPYRFALQAIHGLRPREDAVALEQMDPLTRGEVFHAAQFALFRQLQSTGLLPVTRQRLDEILHAADAVLTRVADEYTERLAPAIERVWTTAIEDLRTDFRAWLREVALAEDGWWPLRFEFGFGLEHPRQFSDPDSTAQPAGILDGYLVRGSMDLVEEHRGKQALRIVDHKTGKMPDRIPVSVGGGEFLQPLLYALAAESLWKRPVEAGQLFYCTQRGGYQRIEVPVNDAGRYRLRQVLRTIDEAIETGFLPAAPAKDACSRCDYRSVCGPYEEERLRRKKPERLGALQDLRGLP